MPGFTMTQRTMAVSGILVIGLTGLALAVTQGYTVLEKLAVLLVLPAGFLWLMSLVVAGLSLRSRSRPIGWLACGLALGMTLFFSPLCAGWLMRSLDPPFRDLQPLEQEPFEAIVVLGGGTSVAPHGAAQLTCSGDRVALAARMYHRGLTPKIICTGKRTEGLDKSGRDPAETAREVLLDLGVAAEDITLVGGINTSQEMKNLAPMLAESSRIGLITSAWHLPRALRLARKQGMNLQPLPADFATPREPSWVATDWMPDAAAARRVTQALREYLAMRLGR